MDKRPDITQKLAEALVTHFNPGGDPRCYWAREVTLDYATNHAIRVDFMHFKPRNNTVSGIEKGDFYYYEIKSSVEDFHSPNGHNFLGEYNYYVMLKDVHEKVKSEIPHFVGVLAPDDNGILKPVKRAHRQDRDRPIAEMLLMMFRSAARDRAERGQCDEYSTC